VKAAIVSLGASTEFHKVVMGAVGFSIMAERRRAAVLEQVASLEAAGAIGDAAILRGHVHERDAATRKAAQDVVLPLAVEAALAASPRLGHVFGERRLCEFLSGLIAAGAMMILHGQEAALQVFEGMAPKSFWHFVGNPLTLLTQDGTLIAGESDDPRHYLDIAAYRRSLRPEGKAGRPKATPKATPKAASSGRKAIDLDKARAIRQMRRAGATLKEIALHHFPGLAPDSSAARGRIARHIEAVDLDDLRPKPRD